MDASTVPLWEPLLIAYLSGNGDFTELYNAAKRPLERMVRRVAPLLPEDLHEDIVQQVFLRLIENPPADGAAGCGMRALIFGMLRNATRQVRAMFAPPGQKTRVENLHAEDDGDASSVSAAGNRSSTSGVDLSEIEEAVGTRWTAEQTTASVLARELLWIMPRHAADAAWLVFAQEFSLVDAAKALNKSRFAVSRALDVAHRAAHDNALAEECGANVPHLALELREFAVPPAA
jgi:DNA-directed RNA polymerase specialized sigma24 family protein